MNKLSLEEIQNLQKSGVNVIIQVTPELVEEMISNAVMRALSTVERQSHDPKFLSVEKTQEVTDVSRTTLWHWERKGILMPVKIGRTVKYRYSDVMNLIEGNAENKKGVS